MTAFRALILCLVALHVVIDTARGGEPPGSGPASPAQRSPQYPLKDRRTLFSDEQNAIARRNIATYPKAKALADKIIAQADEWAAWEDADLVALVPPGAVPRAFDVGTAGCPNCGNEIYEKFGNYGWIVDPKRPFRVTCPVDGSVYPTNDFDAYYRSGFQSRIGWDTKHVDEGRGWTDPETGEKYWFVAYANHWLLHGKLIPGMRAMARAYLLTGDERYAHKAAVLLHRFAEVYPGMDHEPQSRYGEMMRARGRHYPGKIVNHIWETNVAAALAEAYDAVWETIDDDEQLQRATGKTGEQIRGFIEANLLEDAIDAVFEGKIRGNFGMHQTALVYLGLARQFGRQDEWFDGLLDQSSSTPALLGLEFALYNLIYRDGIPSESAPGYNQIWVNKIAGYGELLARTGRDVFVLPRTRRLFDGVLDLVCARAFTPAVGDSGSVWGGIIGRDAATFQAAFRQYGDERYARFLASFGAAGDGGFTSFESLYHPPIEFNADSAELPPQRSRLLDGYGMGILNNPADTVAMSLYYGLKHGHGHFDRLNIEIFANGQPMLPDLGYPDAMNDFVPGIYTWSKNTIAHNTVTVDASRQRGNAPGTVELFADGKFARVIDVSAAGTYPQCEQYRRCVVMVDVDEHRSYFVDFFTVSGGKQHDYGLHGPPGDFEMIGGDWSEPAAGTLAGRDVPLGFIYDNPDMAAPDYKGGYSRYAGSGFQHLFNVRTLGKRSGEWVAEYAHEKDPAARVRIRILPRPGQRMLLAEARVSPAERPEILRYLIARTNGRNLSSRFVSLIEPFRPEKASVSGVEQPDAGRAATAVLVRREDGRSDLIIYNPGGGESRVRAHDVTTTSRVTVVSFDERGKVARAFMAGGSTLKIRDRQFTSPPAVVGTVTSVDPARQTIRVRPKHPGAAGTQPVEAWTGRVAHFTNSLRRTAHPLASVSSEDGELVLTTRDDLLVGRVRVDRVEPGALFTQAALPLAPCYRGVVVANDAMEVAARVGNVDNGRIELARPMADGPELEAGDDAWLVNVGPGDELVIEPVFDWQRMGPPEPTEKEGER